MERRGRSCQCDMCQKVAEGRRLSAHRYMDFLRHRYDIVLRLSEEDGHPLYIYEDSGLFYFGAENIDRARTHEEMGIELGAIPDYIKMCSVELVEPWESPFEFVEDSSSSPKIRV